MPGSLKLFDFEDLLVSAHGNAALGLESGFFITSAIDRFLNEKGLNEEIDIFVIDTSPNLGFLNRVIFLGADYFLTPMMPDAFSVQGIENLGKTFENWKDNWKKTAKVLARDKKISVEKILAGDALFIGFVVNSYNQYGQQPIKNNQEWIRKIPKFVKEFLSRLYNLFSQFISLLSCFYGTIY